MTDSEIVKALENLLELVLVEGCLQRAKTISNTIYLIHRLEARIGIYETCNARKDEAIKHLESEVKRLQAEIKHLDDESDALRADIDFRDKEISELQAEIERLKKLLEQCEDNGEYWESKYKTTKSEAYKKFAEKLHEELRIYGIKDKFNKSLFLNMVDKAKKELVGE